MAGILVDTNVLVYAYDRGEFEKQAKAIRVLEHLALTNVGCLSVQSLSEFYSLTTRGQHPKLTVAEAARQTEQFALSWRILDLTPQIVLEAIRGVRAHQLGYWDAQIWATARLNQLSVVFSEDFNVGSSLDGVRFVNPLAEDFVLQDWA